MGNTHGRGNSHAPAEMIGRLPLFLRTGSMRRSPVEPAGRRHKGSGGGGGGGGDGGTGGGTGGGGSQQRQQEHGLLAGATGVSEPKSPPPLPPSPPRRRRRAATVLSLIVLATAAAAVWSGSSSARIASRGSDSSSSGSDGGLSTLPFLGGEDGGGQGTIDGSRWVRVRSPSAMHPAMYVPGDGMVYCPIAKVREETEREREQKKERFVRFQVPRLFQERGRRERLGV